MDPCPAALVLALLLASSCQEPPPPPAPDGPPPAGPSAPNPIQIENARPGQADWPISRGSTIDTARYRYQEIEAFAAAPSAAPGESVGVAVSTAEDFRAEVYRLGFYGGAGARLVATLGPFRGNQVRPAPAPAASSRLIDASWPVTFGLAVGADWPSGLYLVRLTAAGGAQAYVPVVVRSAARRAPLVLIHSVNTDEAYNLWGGTSIYSDLLTGDGGRANRVSFNRPFLQDYGAGQLLYWEYPAIRFLEQRGYDLDYVSDVDVHERPELLRGRAAVLIIGHSEYWTGAMRDALEAAVAGGSSLANLGGNDLYAQIRYEPSRGAADRVLVAYKDADADHRDNPGVPDTLITVAFRDPPVSRPEQALLGAMYVGTTRDPLQPPAHALQVLAPESWIFAGTGAPALLPAEENWLGWEMDAAFPAAQYPRPPGLVVLTSTDLDLPPGAVANMTLYRAPSGAWVWNGGAMNWAWGLDDFVPDFSEFRGRPRRASAIPRGMLQNFLRTSAAAP